MGWKSKISYAQKTVLSLMKEMSLHYFHILKLEIINKSVPGKQFDVFELEQVFIGIPDDNVCT
jgi:hypothetical protein